MPPASNFACAAASARLPLSAGSGVSSAARARNAAAAAAPPRACARSAERSNSSATASSGPDAACARCQARRSGSVSGSVASASARCASLPLGRCRRPVGRGAHEWMPEPDPGSRSRSAARLRPGRARSSRCRGARPRAKQARVAHRLGRRQQQQSLGRLGQLAGRAGGSDSSRWRGRSVAGRSPNPPASSAGVMPRGSSSRASGLPRVSATIRSRTRSSSRPGTALMSSVRASSSASPRSRSSGRPSKSCLVFGSRTATTIATDSASSRRATKPRISPEAASSHCSVLHETEQRPLLGRRGQQAEHGESDQEPVRDVTGARPKATFSAFCWGCGSASSRSSIGAQS